MKELYFSLTQNIFCSIFHYWNDIQLSSSREAKAYLCVTNIRKPNKSDLTWTYVHSWNVKSSDYQIWDQ